MSCRCYDEWCLAPDVRIQLQLSCPAVSATCCSSPIPTFPTFLERKTWLWRMYVCMYVWPHHRSQGHKYKSVFDSFFQIILHGVTQRSLGLTFATSNTYLYAVCLSHSPFGFWKTWLRCRHLPTPGCRASDWSDPPTLLTDTASLLLLIILSQRQDNFLPSL